MQLFEDDINEKDSNAKNECKEINIDQSGMDVDIAEETIPQLSTGLSQEIMSLNLNKPKDDEVSKLLNEKIINKKFNDKIISIKNKLIKSFCDKINLGDVRKNEINYNSLENILKYMRIIF